MADAISLDGKTTKGGEPGTRHWVSAGDDGFFRGLIDDIGTLVMGRKTYEVVHQRPRPDRLYVVLTHHPENFAAEAVACRLEFITASPKQVVEDIAKRGFKTLLVVGGSVVNTAFLKAGLVDELYLTIEPRIFGAGKSLVESVPLDISLRLRETRALNSHGTLLAHYAIDRNRLDDKRRTS
ncbi:MAG TPA: dihydrofolate reductase family protein [Candidatus Saccharimonadales bacterium]|jgi:dihydrofolate reductase